MNPIKVSLGISQEVGKVVKRRDAIFISIEEAIDILEEVKTKAEL